MNNEQWKVQPLHSPTAAQPLDETDLEFISEKIPSLYYINESTQETFNQLLLRLYIDEKQDMTT